MAPGALLSTVVTMRHVCVVCVCCVCFLQVLRDLVQVIRPDVDAAQSTRWTPRFMLRLDGIQQQTRVPAVCDLDTGAFVCGVCMLACSCEHELTAVTRLHHMLDQWHQCLYSLTHPH